MPACGAPCLSSTSDSQPDMLPHFCPTPLTTQSQRRGRVCNVSVETKVSYSALMPGARLKHKSSHMSPALCTVRSQAPMNCLHARHAGTLPCLIAVCHSGIRPVEGDM